MSGRKKKEKNAPVQYGKPENSSRKGRPKMNYVNMRKPLPKKSIKVSRDTIVSQVAAFLYAIGELKDFQEVVDIEFSDLSQPLVDLKVKIKGDPGGGETIIG